MEVNKIEVIEGRTIIYLSVENMRSGGTFCADKNIYIVYPDGTRMRMEKSRGIPQCPENYKFKSIGEKLEFSLSFPALKQGTGWIDIVEECSDNCFWLYSMTLDNELNNELNRTFELASAGIPANNILLFKNLLDKNR